MLKLRGMDTTAPGLNIFRAGTHVASNGVRHTFTPEHLRDLVASYDPALSEAPIVIGHPKLDDPAYGWAKTLVLRDDGELYAEPKQVDPEFAEIVNKGRYKKISSSIYLPDSPGNPKPGHYYLKHIGFLGAVPPAVKGLRTAQFAEGDGALEFALETPKALPSLAGVLMDMFQRLRDRTIERDGLERADDLIPSWQIRSLGEIANWSDTHTSYAAADTGEPREPQPNPETDMSQQDTAQFAERERQINEQETALQTREQALKNRERAAVRADAVAFAEGLVTDGKLLPRLKAPVVELLTSLPSDQPLSFAEDGQQVSKAPAAVLREVLDSLPKQIDFSEKSGDANAPAAIDFAAPAGTTVDGERAQLHAKAIAYQQRNQGVSYLQAVKAVGG
ncbi:hypothetical protein RDV84_00205 [Lysobacter yananisis]|uniref:Peptidase n=1 Tax=Lysobacter yananisis TaxID=1003114 RepID=A0ABY9PBT3_9GAMM|nr:hypothetical protein [Lysobacter yananisis]WMT03312.1 hypothetical protein RDV84_00205 [Lysobacter yananisis]